jgi:hypothetical protein
MGPVLAAVLAYIALGGAFCALAGSAVFPVIYPARLSFFSTLARRLRFAPALGGLVIGSISLPRKNAWVNILQSGIPFRQPPRAGRQSCVACQPPPPLTVRTQKKNSHARHVHTVSFCK